MVQGSKLTKASVTAAATGATRYVIWDSTLPGFGLRVDPSGRKTFILRYRPKGGGSPKRFVTIGRFGPITAEEARSKAMSLLGEVASGGDPALSKKHAETSSLTVSSACDLFLRTHVEPKRKPNTKDLYVHVIEARIKPQLGSKRLAEVSKAEIAAFHQSMASTPYLANRSLAVLAALFAWANRVELVPEGFNPALRIEKFRESSRERFLSPDELSRLGAALHAAETSGIPYEVDSSRPASKHAANAENRLVIQSPYAVAAIRLLLLTGCRVGEILNLKWSDVDLSRTILILPDSKTGKKTVQLGSPAVKILQGLPRTGDFVIAGPDPKKPRADLKRPWNAIRRRAELHGVRLHDLRHSFASVGAAAGLGLPIIGKLLGHSQSSTTARYAHLADDPLRRGSETIAVQIDNALKGLPSTGRDEPQRFRKDSRVRSSESDDTSS